MSTCRCFIQAGTTASAGLMLISFLVSILTYKAAL